MNSGRVWRERRDSTQAGQDAVPSSAAVWRVTGSLALNSCRVVKIDPEYSPLPARRGDVGEPRLDERRGRTHVGVRGSGGVHRIGLDDGGAVVMGESDSSLRQFGGETLSTIPPVDNKACDRPDGGIVQSGQFPVSLQPAELFARRDGAPSNGRSVCVSEHAYRVAIVDPAVQSLNTALLVRPPEFGTGHAPTHAGAVPELPVLDGKSVQVCESICGYSPEMHFVSRSALDSSLAGSDLLRAVTCQV